MKFVMSCLCCKPPSDLPPIIDVDKVIQDYVWRKIKGDRYPLARLFMRRCDYEIEVPHNYFHFEDVEEDIKENTKASPNKPRKSQTEGSKPIPELSVLSTEFRNNTETEQTFQFRFQKTRSASVNVTFQKGFTIGGKAHFKLGLPKHLTDSSVGGEVNIKYEVTKTTGETFDESVTIEANSEIKVFQKRKYIAKVALAEREFSGTFRVETIMRLPSGSAPIFVRKKRNRELYCIESISDLKSVFAGLPVHVEDVSKPDEKVACYAIKFETTGVIEGVRLLGQKIYLDSELLDEDDTFTVSMPKSMHQLVNGPPPEKLSDVMESSTDSASQESGQDTTDNQPETKILKGPEIPQIVTTSPSSRNSSRRCSDQQYSATTPAQAASLYDSKPADVTSVHFQSRSRVVDHTDISKPVSGSVRVGPGCSSALAGKTESVGVADIKTSSWETGKKLSQSETTYYENVTVPSKSETEVSQMKGKSKCYMKQSRVVDPDAKQTAPSLSDTKQTAKSLENTKQKTKSLADTKQTTKPSTDTKQTTKPDSSTKSSGKAMTGLTSVLDPISRQTAKSDTDATQTQQTDSDTKRTKPADVNVLESKTILRGLLDSELAEKRRIRAKVDLKGDVFTRHSLPVSKNDELRKAVLSEEKRKSLSKLTKCTSV